MKKNLFIIGVVFILAGWMTYHMFQLAKVQCSLCIEFNGSRQCSEAYGPTKEDAIKEAHASACAQVASGVTQSLACNGTPDLDISCK